MSFVKLENVGKTYGSISVLKDLNLRVDKHEVVCLFRFRLQPTARQHAAMDSCVRSHRELYNAALQERRDAWAKGHIRIRYEDQSAQLKEIRSDRQDVTARRPTSVVTSTTNPPAGL